MSKLDNMTIEDFICSEFKITKPIRLIELFGGVGSQAMALRNIGADFEHYKLVEFDKYAIASYNAIHNTNFETSDITKVTGEDLQITNTNEFDYIMTYSFPCQDLSVAGKMGGMSKDSGTRSGLLWEVERLLKETEELPQVLLMENVPQVISKKNIADFKLWQDFLESKGYTNYVDTLNAKNYGVAQNRNRTFMVSVLGNYKYEFPKPIPLTKTMKDYLEDEVDEKYYIKSEKAQQLIQKLIDSKQINKKSIGEEPFRLGGVFDNETKHQAGSVWDKENISPTIDTMQGGWRQPLIIDDLYNNREPRAYSESAPTIRAERTGLKVIEEPVICASRGRNPNNPSDRTVGAETEQILEINSQGLCNTLTSVQKDNLVLIKQATKEGYIECKLNGVADLSYPNSKIRRGRVQESGDVCPTLTASETGICKIESLYRIRKLTPLECWRLMSFNDEDFYKAEKVNSNTQLYKQAGNSIVVNVLEGIFKGLM